jgi:hypothetical protein
MDFVGDLAFPAHLSEYRTELQVGAVSDEARRFVLEVVMRIDRELAAAEEVATCPAAVTLARALVAAADLAPRLPTVEATLAAARAYVADPCEATHRAYFDAASASFPYGPGEGCYAVAETGIAGCEVGSGCRSGSGTLAQLAYTAGWEAVADVLRGPEFASVGGVE